MAGTFGVGTPFTHPAGPWGISPYGAQGLNINPFALQQVYGQPLGSFPIGPGFGNQYRRAAAAAGRSAATTAAAAVAAVGIPRAAAASTAPAGSAARSAHTTPACAASATDPVRTAADPARATVWSDSRAGQFDHAALGGPASGFRDPTGPGDVTPQTRCDVDDLRP